MKKFLKITGISILVILVLLILIPIVFKDKLIEIAKTEINNQVNAKIQFGEFDLSIFTYFPNLNFEINDVTVSGINQFEGDTLMHLKQLTAKVDIMSVFGDQIKVKAVHLIEPQIYAHVLRDTTANWDIAKTDSSATEEVVEEVSETFGDDASFKMALNTFSIQKAQIKYIDESGDLSAIIKDLDYELSGDLSLSQAELKMHMAIEAITVEMEGIKYLNQTKMDYQAGIQADLDKMRFDLLDNQFQLNQLILAFKGFVQMNEVSYDMDLSFDTNKNQFKDLLSLVPAVYTQDFANIKTSGALTMSGMAKGTYSDTQLPAFHIDLNIDNASVQYPDLPTAITQIYVDLKVDNQDGIDDHTVIDLKRFDLKIADNPISARYLTKTPVSDPYIEGYIKGKIDFDKLKDAIPLDSMSIKGLMTMDLEMRGNLSTIEKEDYENFDAKGTIGLEQFVYEASDLDYPVKIESTNFEVAPKYFTLKNFDALVGKSDFHANGQIDNFLAYYFHDELLTGTFNLTSALVDGNELAGDESSTETATTEVADSTAEPMGALELPRNIDFALNTKIDKILYDTYDIQNFNGRVSLKEGVAQMQPVIMNIIDGTLVLGGSYDSRDILAPKIDFQLKMIGFDIAKTFKTFNTVQKLAPIAENCNGKVNIDFSLTAVLDANMEPVQETMNGDGRLQSKNIIIGGSKAMKQLADLLKNDKYKQVDLKDIDGSFKIENGNIIISPVDIKMNNSKATFGGKQGVDQTIDYTLNVNIPRSDLGDANKLIDGLMAQGGDYTKNIDLGETIKADIFITGTVEKPHFSVGVKDTTKNVVDQVKEQVKEKVKEVIDDTKEKAIAEARKKADELMAEAEKQSQALIAESEKQATEIRKNGKLAADQAKVEAKKQIDKLIAEAGSNPIKKVAAQEAGKKIQAEADKKADQLQAEANKKADQLVAETKKQTDNIKQKAKEEGDKLIADAEKM
ncbi:MAG: AsmA family protein [Bacteroidales bacterium]|nr:AsmA family protein [Bacteroidales bacterium]